MRELSVPLRQSVRGILPFLAGSLSAMCCVVGSAGYVGMSDTPASSTSYLWTALAVCFGLLFRYVYRQKGLRPKPGACFFGLLFGVINVLGGILFAYDGWDRLASPVQMAIALVRGVGQGLPMTAAFVWLDDVLRSGKMLSEPDEAPKHELWRYALVMLVCWSPYLIAFFPGTVCWDLGEMVAQFFGQRPVDTWHPVFTTWLIGGCVWIGRLLGSDNLGAALFTALQTGLLAYALSRAVRFLRLLGVKKTLRLCALAFFALVPIWGGYAQFISKDTLYTAALLLFAMSIMRLVTGRAYGMGREAAELFGWGLLTCLLRSNGLYVVLPSGVMAVLFAVRGRRKLPVAAAVAGAVCCALLFSGVLLPALGVRDETASGIYSACFQQSARVLRDHADTVTDEEYEEIDLVLDAENLPELYEPWISDPVKYTFRQYGQGYEIEAEALSRYRRTWLKMAAKYPLTYLESFFAGNLSYYCFAPKIEGETYNNQAGNRLVFETYELGEDPRFLHTEQIGALETVRRLLAAFARGWRHIPLLAMLYACATYTWLLVGAAWSVLSQKLYRVLCAFVPALMSLGVCMLGPVNDYFRYFLPIVAMTLPLLGAANFEGGKNHGEDHRESPSADSVGE